MKEINPKGPMFTLIIASFITGQDSGAGSPALGLAAAAPEALYHLIRTGCMGWSCLTVAH